VQNRFSWARQSPDWRFRSQTREKHKSCNDGRKNTHKSKTRSHISHKFTANAAGENAAGTPRCDSKAIQKTSPETPQLRTQNSRGCFPLPCHRWQSQNKCTYDDLPHPYRYNYFPRSAVRSISKDGQAAANIDKQNSQPQATSWASTSMLPSAAVEDFLNFRIRQETSQRRS
jgi:hypothetical protein